MGITETWLDESVFDSEIAIDNYTICRKDRNRHGGGVCVFIRNDIAFNIRTEFYHEELEAVFIDILLPKSKPILLGILYRPPTQSAFYDILETVLQYCQNFNEQESIFLGDFNTNVSSKSKCSLNSTFKYFCDLFSLKQLINECTRAYSSTIIDLILVSDSQKISQSGVVDCNISDHHLIYCTRKVTHKFIGKHNTVKMRSLKNYNKEAFQQYLVGVDWLPVLNCDSVFDAWNNFKSIFISALDIFAPVKDIRIKQRSEKWIDSDILQCIRDRDKAFQMYKRNKTDENLNNFRTLRNKVQSQIFNAKKNYFKDTLESNKSDSKSLWKCLKDLGLPSKSSQTSSNIGLKIDDEICFDKLKIAEKFNTFYTTVASKLVEKLPPCIISFGASFVHNFYSSKGVKLDSYSFSIVSEEKCFKYINSLSPNKATGLDGIPSRFIRDSAPMIAHPLSHIINLSIIQGAVPDDLKSARVVPLFKKNDKTEVGNYRPVSILCVLSKVLEKVIFDQAQEYLTDNKLLYEFQSGFRQRFSTDTCLMHLSDYIRLQMDKGHLVGMVLLDLQKAFDTVDHGILLMKLKAMGFSASAVRWFSSYLSDRHQLVDVSGVHSTDAGITCGVPQGSILGPLLFLVYVNDMPGAVKHKLLLYADDSAILVSGKCRQDIETILSSEMDVLSQWLISNKLSLHLGKTESILFGSRQRLKPQPSLNVSCNGHTLESKSSVKYLGATIDQGLTFESMARSIIKKANSRLKFLYRKKQFLTFHTKKLLAMSLIQCHFDYASPVWFYGLTKDLKNKLQVTQNKLIRFVLNLDPRSHIGNETFRELNWLPVSDRVDQVALCHVFKIHNNTAPTYMSEHFSPVSNAHSYTTRFRVSVDCSGDSCIDTKRYLLPRVKGFGQKSFAYQGCNRWNLLPQSVRDSKNLSVFKLNIKRHLLQNK